MTDAAAHSHAPVRIGIVSISDRASTGVYEDKGLPALRSEERRVGKECRL